MRVEKVWQKSSNGGNTWVDVAVPDHDPLATAMRNSRAGEIYVEQGDVLFRFFYVPAAASQVKPKPAVKKKAAAKRTAKKSTKGTKR